MGHIWENFLDLGHFSVQCELSFRAVLITAWKVKNKQKKQHNWGILMWLK